MGQVSPGSARTIEAVRRAIQRSEESVRALAGRYGISPTTVQKWRKRGHASDAPMRPSAIRSAVLTAKGQAMVAFPAISCRRWTIASHEAGNSSTFDEVTTFEPKRK